MRTPFIRRLTSLLGICLMLGTAMQSKADDKIVGIHLLSWTSDSLLVELAEVIPSLSEQGINLIFLEVDYHFDFKSHPELRARSRLITPAGARRFADVCRAHGIRLIPQFQTLGHQSWEASTSPLLTVYPEFDLTPGAFPGNEGIYCREWDPTNPRVNEIIFPMIDEIVEAFGADGIHVGMDEIFLLGSDESPNTKGKDPARLFAQVVNEFHAHFVEQKGLEMFMWGDRLIDGEVYSFGEYESSLNGTAPAVDMIPKDIVICDWHYNPASTYESIPMFIEKGFRVLPTSWRRIKGVEALVKYSHGLEHPSMLGHLFTTWSRLDQERLMTYPPMLAGVRTIRSGRYFDVMFYPEPIKADRKLMVQLTTQKPGLDIFYSLEAGDRDSMTDGAHDSGPDRRSLPYKGPIQLKKSAVIRAIAYQREMAVSDVTHQRFTVHKAMGRSVSVSVPASPKYQTRDGVATLVNGVFGSEFYSDGQWVGAEGTGLEAVIDLGKVTSISTVTTHSLNNRPHWVHQAHRVLATGSIDGTTFTPLGSIDTADVDDSVVKHVIHFGARMARYVKVAFPPRIIPEGNEGAGSPAWLFVDEIVVE